MADGRGVIVRVGTSYDGRDLARAQRDIARLQAQMAGPGAAMAKFGGQVQAVGRSMSSFGASLTRNVTLPLLAVGAGIGVAIQRAADLAETMSKVDQVFGTSAGAIKAWSETSATALGQSQQQALDAASTFAIFGKAAGVTGGELVSFSTDLTQLAADLASFNNTNPEEAVAALGAGLRGESEPLRRYGVLLDDATLKARAMQMGIYDGTGTLSQQQRVLAAYQEILAQTTTQQGDFARTSNGLANQQRILKAEIANLTVQLGTAFMPIAQELVALIRDELVPRLQEAADWFGSLDPEVRKMVVAAGAVAAAIGPVVMVLGSMTSSVGGLMTALGPLVGMLGGGGAAAGGLTGALAALTGPVGIVIAAIVGLIAIFVAMWRESETFRTAVTQAFGAVKDAVMEAFNTVKKTLDDNAATLDIIKGAFQVLGDVIGTYVVPIIRDYLIKYFQFIAGYISVVINLVSRLITFYRDLAVTGLRAISSLTSVIRGWADTFLTALGNILNAAVEAFGWVPGVGDQLRGAQERFNTFKDTTLAVFDGVSSGAATMADNIDTATRDRTITVSLETEGWGAGMAGAGLPDWLTQGAAGSQSVPVAPPPVGATGGGGGSDKSGKKKVDPFAAYVKGLMEDARKATAQAKLIARGVPEEMAKDITNAPGWRKVTKNLLHSSRLSLRRYIAMYKSSPEAREAADQAAQLAEDTADRARKAEEARAREAAKRVNQSVSTFVSGVKDEFASLTASIRDFGSVSTFRPDEGIPITARGISANLRQRLGMLRDFNKTMGQLQRLGLSNQVRSDIFAMGPMDGLQYAKAILSGGKKAIGEINALTAQFNAPAVAGRFAQMGVEAATGAQAAALGNRNNIQVGAGAIQITVNGSVTALQRQEIEDAVRRGLNGVGREARSSRKAGVR